jgi:hypothetical protein
MTTFQNVEGYIAKAPKEMQGKLKWVAEELSKK